jgi:hypothetical protein
MEFYARNDIALGCFLEKYCFRLMISHLTYMSGDFNFMPVVCLFLKSGYLKVTLTQLFFAGLPMCVPILTVMFLWLNTCVTLPMVKELCTST